jgi:hypothetical protein
MRPLILIAGTLALALPLAACGNNDQTDNTQNVDENLTAENIVSNDVTAIDAVTGDAANIAAESDINDIGNVSSGGGNATAFPRAKPQTLSSSSGQRPGKAPPNSVANSLGNAE